jgi:hypothetical protein
MMQLLLLFLPLAAAPARASGGDELAALKTRLRNPDKWVRAGAVEKLADAGTREAWEEVLGALSDPQGEVADTAQWELGRAALPEVAEQLLGKQGLGAKDALVRERAAEVLGRLPAPVEPAALARALDDREPRVRRALLAAVATRAAGEGFPEDVEKLAYALERAASEERDPRAAGEALLALAALAPERARAAWPRLAADSPPAAVTCAAARAAEALGLSPGSLAALGRSKERAVRAEAAAALARAGTAEGARALVDLFAAEGEERLARCMLEELRALSGLKHGRDPRPWRDWAAALPPGWRPAARPAAPAVAEGAGERSVSLAGLPILSGRVAFLIDLSGSMWKAREDGKTRKQAVDVELRTCLERLPETTRFNLVPYTSRPLPWKPALEPATARNRAAAAAWFEGLRDSGTGNFFDAFLLALADPEVDSIVMLGDGEPTGGARYRLELLADLVELENLGRAVVVDSILVGTRSRCTLETWQEIARRTGGMSLHVEL